MIRNLKKYLGYSRTMLQDLHCLRWNYSAETNVAYIGWLGRGNLGDEAMYLSHRQHLLNRQRLARAPINRYGRWLASIGGRPEVKTLLVGGGTLLGHTGWLTSITEARSLLRPERLVVLGAGMEDIDFALDTGLATLQGLRDWRILLAEADFVGVRGPLSKISLSKIGVDSDVVGDAALCLTGGRNRLPRLVAGRRPYVAVNVVGKSNGFDMDHIARRREVVAYVRAVGESGLNVVFFGMEQRDVREAQQIRQLVPTAQVLPWSPSVMNVLNLIKGSELVVAERLHGAILAAAAYTPFLMLAYKPKSYDFAESVDALAACVKPGDMSAKVLMERTMALLTDKAHAASVAAAMSCLNDRFNAAHAKWVSAA